MFHHDNALVHTCVVAIAKIHQLGYELLTHSAHSPDLAPKDYLLYPYLKKWLGGQRLEANEAVIAETNVYFESVEKTYIVHVRGYEIGKALDKLY